MNAHGFGTMGAKGSGTGEHYGVQDQVDVYFATFANLWPESEASSPVQKML